MNLRKKPGQNKTYFKKSLMLVLMLFQKIVPNNTKKKIITKRHSVLNPGVFRSMYKKNITTKKTTANIAVPGSICCGYASNNVMA